MDEETDLVMEVGEVEIDGPRRKAQVFWCDSTAFSPVSCHVELVFFLVLFFFILI